MGMHDKAWNKLCDKCQKIYGGIRLYKYMRDDESFVGGCMVCDDCGQAVHCGSCIQVAENST